MSGGPGWGGLVALLAALIAIPLELRREGIPDRLGLAVGALGMVAATAEGVAFLHLASATCAGALGLLLFRRGLLDRGWVLLAVAHAAALGPLGIGVLGLATAGAGLLRRLLQGGRLTEEPAVPRAPLVAAGTASVLLGQLFGLIPG